MILANVALVLCIGQLLTKVVKKVGYENFLYKECLDKKKGWGKNENGGAQTPLHTVIIYKQNS